MGSLVYCNPSSEYTYFQEIYVKLSPNILLIFVAVVSVILTNGLITSLQAMAAEPFRSEEIVLKYKT